MTHHSRLSPDFMCSSTSRSVLVCLLLGSMAACDGAPTAPSEPIAARIAVLSGDNQVAMAGSWIPLSVRVTDADNRAVPDVRVYWQVTAGAGDFARFPQEGPLNQSFTVTGDSGVAGVYARLTLVGTSTVTASLAGPRIAPVTFTTTVTKPADLVISFGPTFDCTGTSDPVGFVVGGKNASSVSVPLGATVEWKYMDWVHPACTARIISTSAPNGGQPFDSGIMSPGQGFRFVPGVAGTWHYMDALSGGRGTLTVTPAPEPPRPPASPSDEFIYVANADGSGAAQLLRGGSPAWSPDGRRIAFQRDGEIRVVNAGGSNDTRLAVGGQPTWSPDGTRLAFVGSEGISVMNADGSAVRTLVRHDFRDDTYRPYDMGVGQPAWSPDGARIAFVHLGDGDTQPAQAFVIGTDGSNRRLLTPTINGARYAESYPAWSPDGSKIVFWSYGYGLALINSDGGFPTTVYREFPAVAFASEPAWSPNGSSIAFTRRQDSSAPAIWTVSPSGSGARVLIPDGYDAAWSPDGGHIAFVRTRGQ